MVDLRKGKEQVGVVRPDLFIIYESLQYYTSHYHEHDTEKYSNFSIGIEFPGVPVRKSESWDLG